MKNLTLKLLLSIMVCSTIATSLLFGVSIYKNTSTLITETEKILTLSSEKYANEFNTAFKNTEGMVDAISANVNATFSMNEYKNNPDYFQEYQSYLDDVIRETVQSNHDINGLYFTFSPYLTSTPQEVWYAHGDNNSPKKILPDFGAGLRDFTLPAKPEMEYFFRPVQSGTGEWTGPYMDTDISLNMISYSKAVFAGDVIIGVAGADILTSDTIGLVENMKIYEDSQAFLLDENLDPIIVPENYEASAFLANRENGKLASTLVSSDSGLIKTYKGSSEFVLAYAHLSNDWILLIEQPAPSVYSSITLLYSILVLFAVAVIAVSLAFAAIIFKKNSRTIYNATESLHLIYSGDYVPQSPDSLKKHGDELGEFSKVVSDVQEVFLLQASQNKEKDLLLAYQAKYARVSELVSDASKHWKQPFSNINLALLNLYDSYICGDMTAETFKLSIDKTMTFVNDVLSTIEDFNRFLKPSYEGTICNIAHLVEFALDLIRDNLQFNQITVNTNIADNLLFFDHQNEACHMLLNILNTATTSILEANSPSKEILIFGFLNEDIITLEISNIGKHLADDIISNNTLENVNIKNTIDGVCHTITFKSSN